MIGIRTGNLYRSFGRKDKNSATKISYANGKITGVICSALPYADIHNRGGFIASKGKMHKYFYAMYKKTKNEFYKIVFLSVIKKGGVSIKSTKYFDEAIKIYNDEILLTQINNLVDEIIKVMDKDIDIAVDMAVNLFKNLADELPESFQLVLGEIMIDRGVISPESMRFVS